jgi:hypothetical protein
MTFVDSPLDVVPLDRSTGSPDAARADPTVR